MFAAVIAIAIGIATVSTWQSNEQKSKKPSFKVSSMSELRARTPEDRLNAKFFDTWGAILLKPGHTVVRPAEWPPEVPPDMPRTDYLTFLREFACSGRAFVLGRATGERVLLNKSETFLFTDYTVDIDQWIRPSGGPRQISVLVPGGSVDVAGEPTVAESGQSIPLNERYLLVLKRVPAGKSFSVAASPLADGDDWTMALRDPNLPRELAGGKVQLDQFVRDLTAASTHCAGGKQ